MVESPCMKICELNSDGVCIGCGRDRAEIGAWTGMSDLDRLKTNEAAAERLRGLAQGDKKGAASR